MLNERILSELRTLDTARENLIDQIVDCEQTLFILKEKLSSMETLEGKLLKQIKS